MRYPILHIQALISTYHIISWITCMAVSFAPLSTCRSLRVQERREEQEDLPAISFSCSGSRGGWRGSSSSSLEASCMLHQSARTAASSAGEETDQLRAASSSGCSCRLSSSGMAVSGRGTRTVESSSEAQGMVEKWLGWS